MSCNLQQGHLNIGHFFTRLGLCLVAPGRLRVLAAVTLFVLALDDTVQTLDIASHVVSV